MKDNSTTLTWRQYEAGKAYKRRIGLYENIKRNERYYRGDQWYGASVPDLPKPIFNVIRRIVDYLVCTVLSGNVSIAYTDEDLPFTESAAVRRALVRGTEILTRHAAYRWEREKLDSLMYRLLLDAALSGDGVLYCQWDPTVRTGQPYQGDIVTRVVDNTDLFVSDVNKTDIQSQEYIILSGRESVASLRREARLYGASEQEIKKILPDVSDGCGSGDLSELELEDTNAAKATYLIKFWREDGHVVCEKSTRAAVIRRANTGLRRYPVAYFNWYPTKNSFHGTSPVTGMIPNQRFINRAYAMVMKHMTDTAFSKVIYDKSKIPEWSNEVGEAIAAVGGGNISDAVSVVGVGSMQSGYLELIENAISNTKELSGATDTALGEKDPTNTSAILAMQEAARIPLMQVRSAFCRCLEELAAIWADMIFNYYPQGRLVTFERDGQLVAESYDFSRLREALVSAHVEVGNVDRLSPITTQTLLDRLLAEKCISAESYISLLPSGLIQNRERLLEEIRKNEERRADGDE